MRIRALRRPVESKLGANAFIESRVNLVPFNDGLVIEFRLTEVYKMMPTPHITGIREFFNSIPNVDALNNLFGIYRCERYLGKLTYKVPLLWYTGAKPPSCEFHRSLVQGVSEVRHFLTAYALVDQVVGQQVHKPDLDVHGNMDSYDANFEYSTLEASAPTTPV